ncbi:MAG: hypothetical protein A2275_09945 [Bacteroidetes bacterium RIFOXYA12_FULL_35_11]|nr:MAG: hypothetical protein A2X01_03630 [Bacteroidetes bacterium GWF2_35_48]OFY82319.1 MAG: hypothetical protein A2275_09945 [Bacteroidetes bacterium RIFOXYA12_FULL_35_11]OFY97491.1 MAG: hypothetical protein A2309_06930 [Bacteroidetes bacterium RIFOXYB2_FULL_35_7]OFZ04239.1 MAG: hypothetical protein A2491_19955 [Bacteroidetes bacterium RIFOXYC12_FULL_35_7]
MSNYQKNKKTSIFFIIMQSIFTDKKKTPGAEDLKAAIGDTFDIWKIISDFTFKIKPTAKDSWHFSGNKYGWSFRISDKKRVLIYLLPRDKFFKIAFVFGQKATNKIIESNIAEILKQELLNAKVYAEGRGIRIDIKDKVLLNDLFKLIEIKNSN